MSQRTKHFLFAAVAFLLFFGGVETVLRLIGFQYAETPDLMKHFYINNYIETQNSQTDTVRFTPHETRMWTGKRNLAPYNGKGFMGEEIPLQRTPGTKRILFLGDSCTNSGKSHYPEKTVHLLKERYGIKAEALIAAVGGYSTYQGLLFLREALPYSPDLIVAYFGWNDHWLAQGGSPDNEFRGFSKTEILVKNTLGPLRTYQLLHYLIYPPMLKRQEKVFSLQEASLYLRVPPNRFSENVQEMAREARKIGARIVFIVPPLGRHITETPKDFLFQTELIPDIHEFYAKLLLFSLKEDRNSITVDFRDLDFNRQLMLDDGIHPTEKGYEVIAERLVEAIMQEDALGRNRLAAD